MQPVHQSNSFKPFLEEQLKKLDNGYEVDIVNVKRIINDELILKPNSIFDYKNKLFRNIKQYIIDRNEKKKLKSTNKRTQKIDESEKDETPVNKDVPVIKIVTDVNRNLKKFSPLEMDCVKDKALLFEK